MTAIPETSIKIGRIIMNTATPYVVLALVVVIIVGWTPLGRAVTYTLTDNHGRSSVDIDDITGEIQLWNVPASGPNHLAGQAMRFRRGNTGDERSMETLVLTETLQQRANSLTLQYEDPAGDFTIRLVYALSAPSSNRSILGEQILIINTSTGPLDFHLFEYVDFDLDRTPVDSLLKEVSTTQVRQHEDPGLAGRVVDGFVDNARTGKTQIPNITELGIYPNQAYRLGVGLPDTDGPTTLKESGVGSSLINKDFSWARQWDFTLDSNAPRYVSNLRYLLDVVPLPIPNTLPLLGIGLAVLLASCWRRR